MTVFVQLESADAIIFSVSLICIVIETYRIFFAQINNVAKNGGLDLRNEPLESRIQFSLVEASLRCFFNKLKPQNYCAQPKIDATANRMMMMMPVVMIIICL